MKSPHLLRLASILSLCMVIGCGGAKTSSSSTVKGVITLDGATLPEGTINFASPTTGDAVIAKVTDGKFVVPGTMVPGVYKVVVTPPAPTPDNPTPPASKIPEKYRLQETSDLSSTITGGANDIKFDLKSS